MDTRERRWRRFRALLDLIGKMGRGDFFWSPTSGSPDVRREAVTRALLRAEIRVFGLGLNRQPLPKLAVAVCDTCGEDAATCGGNLCASCGEPLLCRERCADNWDHVCGKHEECCAADWDDSMTREEDEAAYRELRASELRANGGRY